MVGAEAKPLTRDDQASVHILYRKWSDEGYCVLGIATKELRRGPNYGHKDDAGLTLEGFLLFQDAPKQGVREVLKKLAHKKGVLTKVISGANRYAVRHLAHEIGLPHRHILTGKDLLHLSDEG